MWTKKAVAVVVGAIGLTVFGLIVRNLPLMAVSTFFLTYAIISMFVNRQSRILPERFMSNEKVFEDLEPVTSAKQ